MRLTRVLFEVDVDGAEGDPFAVGRGHRFVDALELHHVVKGEGTLAGVSIRRRGLRGGRRVLRTLCESRKNDGENNNSYKDVTHSCAPRELRSITKRRLW